MSLLPGPVAASGDPDTAAKARASERRDEGGREVSLERTLPPGSPGGALTSRRSPELLTGSELSQAELVPAVAGTREARCPENGQGVSFSFPMMSKSPRTRHLLGTMACLFPWTLCWMPGW